MKLDYCSYTAPLDRAQIDTPLEIVNQLLDNLPSEIWKNKDITFLDPCVKTGRFLTQIYLRLMDGLSQEIPDNYQRSNHILTQQLYGIGITKIQAMRSRKNLYGTKNANKSFLAQFDNNEGNIKYITNLITRDNVNIFKFEGVFNMKFDVIIGNPPYQEMDGGGTGSSAMPLYNKFIERLQLLDPTYLSFIIPARWFTGGKGLDTFRHNMLNDTHIQYLTDYLDAKLCFPSQDIEGGVCYFLRNKNYNGKCTITTIQDNNNIITTYRYLNGENHTDEVFIRDPQVVNIIEKIWLNTSLKSFSSLVSTRNQFNLSNNITETPNGALRVMGYFNRRRSYKNIDIALIRNNEYINKYKIFISKADGAAGQIGNPIPARIIGQPALGELNDVCTETYLVVGPFDTQEERNNVEKYMRTKFFRFLVGARKNKNMTTATYSYVPILDFHKEWTDNELYNLFNLTQQEIDYIEKMIAVL